MSLEYGLIGNCKTAALVSKSGSIDWCCFPRFDSPSVFGKILDAEKGGSFAIIPVGNYRTNQRYYRETNILETTFINGRSRFVVYDFFPRFREGERIVALPEIHRFIVVKKGRPNVTVFFDPKFNYAKNGTSVRKEGNRLIADDGEDALFLYSDLDLQKIMKGEQVMLRRENYIMVSYGRPEYPSLSFVKQVFQRTLWYWRDFVKRSTLPKYYQSEVTRSVLLLKMLTHESGAVIAAPTTSLPEIIGKERNWDYRYCWIRDASFTIDALSKICHFDEAETFVNWLTKICLKSRGVLQVMYGVGGETELVERTLDHLNGYQGSKPVRIGNAAYSQTQLDSYGEVIETFYLFYQHYKYHEFHTPQWELVHLLVEHVVRNWRKRDSGIWEFRGKTQQHTFSKIMCWVALDRGVKLALKMKKAQTAKRWKRIRAEIRKDIMEKAWNPNLRSFVMYYGADFVDASLLLMPYFGFLPANHPQMRRTIERCKEDLLHRGFAYRYIAPDDFGRPENAFTICTFWLIDALYLLGEKAEAKKLFRNLLQYANHLGLFSEDLNPVTRELTGNFPQAYTHLALVNTAILLSSGKVRRPACNIRLELFKVKA